MSGPRREWNGSRSREPSEDAEVGVNLNAVDAADADRAESRFVLQEAELALDGSTSPAKVAPPSFDSRGISG